MRRLARHVTVHVDGETEPRLCGPGPVPDHIAELIEMPGVWADDVDQVDDDTDTDTGGVGDGIVERPDPRSGRAKWAAYAESLDIDVDDDMDKATIRAAVDAVDELGDDEPDD